MGNLYIDPTFYTTKPDSSGRLEKELRTYDLLDTLEIPYIRVEHDVTETIESCLAVEEMLEIDICKNLFLCNTQKTQFYLLMMPGNKKLKTGELGRQIQSPRLSFAPSEFMEEYLDITPGSVSVLGLMNDHNHHVQLLIDQDIMNQKYVGCHPCINTASLKIEMQDLLYKFLPNIKHDPIIVNL
jgi:Ala-tRNA(Pro) deacylase